MIAGFGTELLCVICRLFFDDCARECTRTLARTASFADPYYNTVNTIRRLLGRIALIGSVSRLGATALDAGTLLSRGLVLFARDARGGGSDFEVTISRFGRHGNIWISSFSDYFTLWELFRADEYERALEDLPVSRDPVRTVLDLGSNVGYSLQYFRMRFPEARIFGVEPDPANFEHLRRQAALAGNATAMPVAVAKHDGSVTFFVDPHRGQSSSMHRRQERQTEVRVEAYSLDSLVQTLALDRIDLLKFDIEGAEMEVFSAFTGWASVETFLGELHTDTGAWKLADILELFRATHDVATTELGPDRHMLTAVRHRA
jgi:FkbM family methyltransferase